MTNTAPSTTALHVALRRAAHQIVDEPKVLCDPLAVRMAGLGGDAPERALPRWLEQTPLECKLRAFLVARSRCAEDELHAAIERGVGQYVILGAGLDTFAYRNPYPEDALQVFEVDHPGTQAWKRMRLEEEGIPIPGSLTFSPVNFETETLENGLGRVGFDTGKPALFSWLGVTPYMTSAAINATLRFVAAMPVGSGIVFDYMLSPSLLSPPARQVLEHLSHLVAMAGEPIQSLFDPSALMDSLRAMGFGQIEDLGAEELNGRYFKDRTDELRVGGLAHVMIARVPAV